MRALRFIRLVFRFAVAWLDWHFASKKDLVVQQQGEISNPEKVFVYCHWSRDNMPLATEIEMLRVVKKADYQTIVVINQSEDALTIPAIWKNISDVVLIRKNLGRDLAAYKAALNWMYKKDCQPELTILANNSIFWAPTKLVAFLNKIENSHSELGAATVSLQPFKHMQTFVVFCNKRFFGELREGMNKTIRNVHFKESAVLSGELKLSKYFIAKKIPFEAIFSLTQLISRATEELESEETVELSRIRIKRSVTQIASGNPVNPSHFFWYELFQLGFPGVKKDLILKNPSAIEDIYDSRIQGKLFSKDLELSEFPATYSHISGVLNKTRRVLKI